MLWAVFVEELLFFFCIYSMFFTWIQHMMHHQYIQCTTSTSRNSFSLQHLKKSVVDLFDQALWREMGKNLKL